MIIVCDSEQRGPMGNAFPVPSISERELFALGLQVYYYSWSPSTEQPQVAGLCRLASPGSRGIFEVTCHCTRLLPAGCLWLSQLVYKAASLIACEPAWSEHQGSCFQIPAP